MITEKSCGPGMVVDISRFTHALTFGRPLSRKIKPRGGCRHKTRTFSKGCIKKVGRGKESVHLTHSFRSTNRRTEKYNKISHDLSSDGITRLT